MQPKRILRAKPLEHVNRFFGADMIAAHHFSRAESADRDQRQPWLAVPGGIAHPASVAPAGIAGEEQVSAWQNHGEARPERPVAIGHPARVPMMDAVDDD